MDPATTSAAAVPLPLQENKKKRGRMLQRKKKRKNTLGKKLVQKNLFEKTDSGNLFSKILNRF